MSTIKQQKAAELLVDSMRKGNKKTMGQILTEAGYKKIAKKPGLVLNAKGFQEYLAKIDDTKIVDKWREWALSGKDKRVALEAGREILKLKDRYPAKKSKVVGLFGVLDDLTRDDFGKDGE